jgi:hypothetical protein
MNGRPCKDKPLFSGMPAMAHPKNYINHEKRGTIPSVLSVVKIKIFKWGYLWV